jgi:peptidoglycan-associated lipoprotein
MKINNVYSTVLVLAVVLAATGCKHKPVKVTPIPGQGADVSDVNNPNTLNTPPINNSQNVGTTQIAPTAYNPDNFNQDDKTLAAYTIHFAFDSAVIRDSDQASLQAVAAALNQNQNDQLLVQGNCDERGTEEYNRSLGERRALAAREALAGMGVSPDRVHEISFGKDKPVDPGHDEAAWSKNRRDDFILLIPKAGMQ